MKNTTRIAIVLSISLAYFLAEITGKSSLLLTLDIRLTLDIPVGFRTKSLALIADAVRVSSRPLITPVTHDCATSTVPLP